MRNLRGAHAQRCRNLCTTTPICMHNGLRFDCTRGAVYASKALGCFKKLRDYLEYSRDFIYHKPTILIY